MLSPFLTLSLAVPRVSAQLHGEQPSYLKGDNFFKFVCTDCSDDGKESFERMRLTWQQVISRIYKFRMMSSHRHI